MQNCTHQDLRASSNHNRHGAGTRGDAAPPSLPTARSSNRAGTSATARTAVPARSHRATKQSSRQAGPAWEEGESEFRNRKGWAQGGGSGSEVGGFYWGDKTSRESELSSIDDEIKSLVNVRQNKGRQYAAIVANGTPLSCSRTSRASSRWRACRGRKPRGARRPAPSPSPSPCRSRLPSPSPGDPFPLA